jgi:hypothetical protein
MAIRGFPRAAPPLSATALVLVLAGCAGDARVVEVRATDDPAVLDVFVDTCNADLNTTVTETGEEVVIDVEDSDRALFDAGGDDCQDLVTIELDEPLGERSVVLADGTPVVLLPFPTPTAVSDETAAGAISYCGLDDLPSLDLDRQWTEAAIIRHNENVDRAHLTAEPYRSDPAWAGLYGRYDDDGEHVFIFRFTDVDLQREIDIGEAMDDLPFEIALATYTDDELDAAKLRIEERLLAAGYGSVTGVGGSSNLQVPGRIVVYMSNPADGAVLAERIGLEPPYGPFCIWPHPSVDETLGD